MFSMSSASSSDGTTGVMKPVSKQRLSKHISAYRTVLWKRWCHPLGLHRVLIREVNAEESSVQDSYESVVSWRSWETDGAFSWISQVPEWLKPNWQEDFIAIWSDSFCVEIHYQENPSACATVNWKCVEQQ
jgi:hypothetical protein